MAAKTGIDHVALNLDGDTWERVQDLATHLDVNAVEVVRRSVMMMEKLCGLAKPDVHRLRA